MSKKKCKTKKQTDKENSPTTIQEEKHVPIQTTIAKNDTSIPLEAKPHNNTIQESQEPTWHKKVEQETNTQKYHKYSD
ncbi:hypothetical protein F8M41_020892 [Gigaspora margarita]|uniref:Uncharacterized protein n=1 Tax=Gigaspora margarita TaxID=4874 RepID=A0A8H4EJC9_GIGMA|nr:hypothetical protein F8M41_020892 [Gigaspora margarita]